MKKIGKIRGSIIVFYDEHGCYRTMKDLQKPMKEEAKELGSNFFTQWDLNSFEVSFIDNLVHIIGHVAMSRLNEGIVLNSEAIQVASVKDKWVFSSYLPIEAMDLLKGFLESRTD